MDMLEWQSKNIGLEKGVHRTGSYAGVCRSLETTDDA